MSSYRLCYLGYGKAIATAEEAISRLAFRDTEVEVAECNVDNLYETVNQKLSEGYEIFVGGFGNAAEFMRSIRGNLIEIQIGLPEYLVAIQKALEIGTRPAVALYQHSPKPDLGPLSKIIGIEIELLRYEDGSELFQLLSNSSSDVIVGASHANQAALSLGKQSVLLQPGVESIMSAISQARDYAIEMESERYNQAIIRSVLNNSTFGLVVSDRNGKITGFNHAAQNMTGISSKVARGKRMQELFPTLNTMEFMNSEEEKIDEYHLINEIMFRCVQTKIHVSRRLIGVLTTLNFDTRSRRHNADKAGSLAAHAMNSFGSLVANSGAMADLVSKASGYAYSSYNVIVCGDESTGREQLAQCLHNASPNKAGPYVRIDLASVGSVDAGRFLLGCDERGMHVSGLLEQANHGTAILENLAYASPHALNIILDVIGTRSMKPLGSSISTPADMRFITIVTRDQLAQMSPVHRSKLGTFTLETPTLVQRKDDIHELFLATLNSLSDVKIKEKSITPQMRALLEGYSWPGNIAQLWGVAERYLHALSSSAKPSSSLRYEMLLNAIGEDLVLEDIKQRYPVLTEPDIADYGAFRTAVNVLKDTMGYNNNVLAEKLGISRTTLWRYLKS